MKVLPYLVFIALFTQTLLGFGQTDVAGCTDPLAGNYNPSATLDDGTCCYLEHHLVFTSEGTGEILLYPADYSNSPIYMSFPGVNYACLNGGCYVIYANNYIADVDLICSVAIDGQPAFEVSAFGLMGLDYPFSIGSNIVEGCTDPAACNFNELATCSNGSCIYSCYGCTDPTAPNYNPEASVDDGTCCTNENWYSFVSDNECYVSFYSASTGFLGQIITPNQNGACLPAGCIEMYVQSNSILEEVISFSLFSPTGQTIVSESINIGGAFSTTFSTDGAIMGCVDVNACNYDPLATCANYYMCDYSCLGCTDPEAPNFDPQATVDNGTCCTNDNWISISANGDCSIQISNTYSGNYYYNTFSVAAGVQNFCLPDGCFSVTVYSAYIETEATIQIYDVNGNLLLENTTVNGLGIGSFTKNGIVGCLDPASCNYNPNATCSDYTSCDYSCFGCTDPIADNYNPESTIDNGTCCYNQYTVEMSGPGYFYVYPTQGYNYYGGTYPETNSFCVENGCYYFYASSPTSEPITFTLYNEEGNLIFSSSSNAYGFVEGYFDVNATSGCTDPNACNFDSLANCDDGSCNFDCYGCTDSNAPNYNPNATIDNGQCCYNNWYTVSFSQPTYWTVSPMTNNEGYTSGSYPESNGFCMGNACFAFTGFSFLGGAVEFTIYNEDGSIYYTGISDEGGSVYVVFSENDILGCMDNSACNYDPTATCSDWYVCDYGCYGCTNPEAANFDPTATIDNGTCCTSNWYTIQMSGDAYWYVQNYQQGLYAGGNYPSQNGFCSAATCFSLNIYSSNAEPIEYSVINPDGEVVYSGVIDNAYSSFVSISAIGEVAGCTDPSSCNYNSDATCDDGSCNYYCGGCIDPAALNYNELAWYDDGSCFYVPESPMMNLMVDTDEAEQIYYVRMDVVELGNGAPYLLSSDYDNDMIMIDENGQYFAGPYPCGEDIVISVQSAELGMMEYLVTDPLNGSCAVASGVSNVEEDVLSVYPNPTTGIVNFKGLTPGMASIEVFDLMGRNVYSSTQNIASNTYTLDLTNLNDGVYQIRVTSKNKAETHQIVIGR